MLMSFLLINVFGAAIIANQRAPSYKALQATSLFFTITFASIIGSVLSAINAATSALYHQNYYTNLLSLRWRVVWFLPSGKLIGMAVISVVWRGFTCRAALHWPATVPVRPGSRSGMVAFSLFSSREAAGWQASTRISCQLFILLRPPAVTSARPQFAGGSIEGGIAACIFKLLMA